MLCSLDSLSAIVISQVERREKVKLPVPKMIACLVAQRRRPFVKTVKVVIKCIDYTVLLFDNHYNTTDSFFCLEGFAVWALA